MSNYMVKIYLCQSKAKKKNNCCLNFTDPWAARSRTACSRAHELRTKGCVFTYRPHAHRPRAHELCAHGYKSFISTY